MDYTRDNPLVTTGRFAVYNEREYWRRLHAGSRHVVVALMAVLTVLFAWEALIALAYMPSWADKIVTLAVVVPATVFTCIYPFRVINAEKTRFLNDFFTEQADKARQAVGYTVALYDDRVVYTDLRGETVIPFSRVTLCTETAHGLYLQAGTTAVLWRSADLTAEQLSAVRDWLRARIPAQRIRVKRAAKGALTEPLLMPLFQNPDRVVARAALTSEYPFLRSIRQKRTRDLTQRFVFPAMLVYGAVIAQVISLVYYYLVNLALICAGCVMLGVLFTTWFTREKSEKIPLSLAFTVEGLAVFTQGQSSFTMWQRLKVRLAAHGIWLISPNGDRWFVPFRSMDDPDAVRQLIKGESYNG